MSRLKLVLPVLLLSSSLLFAGFGSMETYLPAVGRVPGQGARSTTRPSGPRT
jgi:hypothetical protein